jgi:hypothetical protein
MSKFYEVSVNGTPVARFQNPDHAQKYAEMLARTTRGVAVYQVERGDL